MFSHILGMPKLVSTVPNYTFLKLKMPGPRGVITVDTSFQHAYECKVECCDHASAVVATKELATLREEVAEKTANAKTTTGSFKPAEGSKEVHVDPSGSEAKRVRIGTSLSSE